MGLKCPLWLSSVAVGARRGASRTIRQRGGAGHAMSRAQGARRSSSSSLRLFEEAISGRAGNSYHSLLTPGRQDGEPTSPPQPHRVLPWSPVPAETAPHVLGTLGHGVPQVGGHPKRVHPTACSRTEPCGVAAPLPSTHRGRGERVGGTGPIHPHISRCYLGVPPIPNPEQARSLRPHKPSFQSTPAVPGLCSGADTPTDAQTPEGAGGGRCGWPLPLSVLWSSMCHLWVPTAPFDLGFAFPPRPPLIRSRSSGAGARKGPQ